MAETARSSKTLGQANWRFVDIVICTLIINLLSLAMPLAMLQVYDRILPNEAMGTAGVLIVGVATAVILEAALRYGRSHLLGAIGALYEYRVGLAAFHHLLKSRIDAFERVGSGVLMDRFNALQATRELYSGQAILSLFDLPFMAIFLFIIWKIGGILVIVPLAMIAFFALSTLLQGRFLSNAVNRQISVEEDRQGFLVGALAGRLSVKAMGIEAALQRRYEKLQHERELSANKVDLWSSTMFNQGAALAQFSTIGVVTLGALQVLNGDLTTGGLAACTMLAGRALHPLNNAVGFWTRFQSMRSAKRRFNGVFDLPLAHVSTDNAQLKPEISGAFSLKDVSFKFEDADKPLLHSIDLDMAPGEAIAITGENGSGKSILLSLIAGLSSPTSGSVSFDGVPAGSIDPLFLRERVVLLPQKESIFHGTILQNLTMFRPELADSALSVARLLGLEEMIDALPNGFRTQVGEGTATRLPRGVVQGIVIARALVNRPKLLLFDEPNSAVDNVADRFLKDMLRSLKGHCGLVIVSYRPSVLRIADRLYHLDDGQLHSDSLNPGDLE